MSDYTGVLLTTAATIIAALLGLIGTLLLMVHRNAKKAATKTDVLVENVQNSHQLGMRDDLDEKFGTVGEIMQEIRADISDLRGDIKLIRRDQTEDRVSANRAVSAANRAVDEARSAVSEAQKAARIAKQAFKKSEDEKED